jgi:hypothetical protein
MATLEEVSKAAVTVVSPRGLIGALKEHRKCVTAAICKAKQSKRRAFQHPNTKDEVYNQAVTVFINSADFDEARPCDGAELWVGRAMLELLALCHREGFDAEKAMRAAWRQMKEQVKHEN